MAEMGFDPRATNSEASTLKLTRNEMMITYCNHIRWRGQQKSLCHLKKIKREAEFSCVSKGIWDGVTCSL